MSSMYGTVARMRLKPGMEPQMQALMREYESLNVPGHIATAVYKMDADLNEYYMSVVFKDKESYVKNAEDPAQDARFHKMMELLQSEPEWHDGELAYSMGIR